MNNLRGADEQKAKAARDAAVQQARESLEKQRVPRDEAFVQRRTEQQTKLAEQALKAKTDKQVEQQYKAARSEQQTKDDAVVVELRASEHEAKSNLEPPTK